MARLKKAEKEMIRKCIAFAKESLSNNDYVSFDFMEFTNREKNQIELNDILTKLEDRYK